MLSSSSQFQIGFESLMLPKSQTWNINPNFIVWLWEKKTKCVCDHTLNPFLPALSFSIRTMCSGLTPLRWRMGKGRVRMTLATMLHLYSSVTKPIYMSWSSFNYRFLLKLVWNISSIKDQSVNGCLIMSPRWWAICRRGHRLDGTGLHHLSKPGKTPFHPHWTAWLTLAQWSVCV